MSEGTRPPYPGGDAHLDETLGLDLAAGLLSPEEQRAVAEHARRCSPCEARLLAWTGEAERLKATDAPVRGGDGRFVLPGEARGWVSRVPPASATVHAFPRRRLPVLLPAAGILAAAVVALVVLPRTRNPHPAESYWIPPVSEGTVSRAARPDVDPDLAAGFNAYGDERAGEAVRLLERARAAGDLDLLRRLYLAGALYNSGEAAAAAETLRALDVETLPEPWKDEAGWLYALALTGSGHAGEGTAWFERLAGREGEIGDRARRRLGLSPSRP
jgi:anti-sigma factor RsiW